MTDIFLQFVLARGNDNTENLVQILIFVFIGVAALIKNIITAKKQQDKKQNRPMSQKSAQRASASAEKAKFQKEHIEKFLGSILQPKRFPQQKPSVSVEQRPKQPIMTYQQNAVTSDIGNLKTFSPPPADVSIYQTLSEPVSEITLGSSKDEKPVEKKAKPKTDTKSMEVFPVFSDSDDLRMAILYSEILGKPMCLRENEIYQND